MTVFLTACIQQIIIMVFKVLPENKHFYTTDSYFIYIYHHQCRWQVIAEVEIGRLGERTA